MLNLRHEREHRPGGFYVVVSFLHDLVKSLGGDERRKKASAAAVGAAGAAVVSKHSPLKLAFAPSTGTELVAASDDAGDGSGRGRETKDGWASNGVLQVRYGWKIMAECRAW